MESGAEMLVHICLAQDAAVLRRGGRSVGSGGARAVKVELLASIPALPDLAASRIKAEDDSSLFLIFLRGATEFRGAGQLGRMFVEAASRLNVKVLLLDSGINSPAKQVNFQPSASSLPCGSEHIDGPFSSAPHIRELASKVDILTIEIEHVDANVLDQVLKEEMIKEVHPRPSTIKLIQDKYNQKVHLVSKGLPVAEYECVGKDESSPSDPTEAKEDQFKGALESIKKFGLPLMLKSRTQAYDGKGNFVLRSAEEDKIREAIKALGDGTRGLYCEKWAEFEREIAVMVVRSSSGEVKAYPAVETVHRDNICHTVYAPLRSSDPTVEARAREIAQRAVSTFEGAGVFGVEMFSMKNGELLINEIAPRPHNSGHYTIEACETSQYENHLRAILGYPLGSTALKVGSAAMVNILGLADLDTDPKALEKTFAPAVKSLEVPGSTVHLYGKTGCRKGRKMGHVTIVGQNDSVVKERLDLVLEALESATKASASPSKKLDKSLTLEGILSSSSSATSTSNTSSTSATLPPSTPYSPLDFSHPAPLVGIIMGSDSDLPVMLPAAHILKKFNVPFELSIVSAHRTPDRMREYSRSAPSRGLKCIIAGAGGAAHLPGMVAAQTALPVIGVPVKGSTLDGVDSLHSIVQMPRGIPTATVAINNSTNAALLAVRILGSSDPDYLSRMQIYMEEMQREVEGKIEKLGKEGWDYGKK